MRRGKIGGESRAGWTSNVAASNGAAPKKTALAGDIEKLAGAGAQLLKTVGLVPDASPAAASDQPKVKLLALLSGVADPSPLPPIHKKMLAQYGADVAAELPLLSRTLEEKMDAIARRLCELYELPALLLPRLIVLDAPEWVFLMVEPNKKDSESERGLHHNTIYTSVGALERLLSTPNFKSEEQLAMLFAILGHEVAHSIEMIDPDSKTSAHMNLADEKLQKVMLRVASHYREYKADTEAAVGLHATGTDPKWLIRVLETIDVAWKDVSQLGSTHPEPKTRAYVLSVAAALLRQQEGNSALELPDPLDSGERAKIRGLFEKALERRTQEKLNILPATIEETLAAIDQALAEYKDATNPWGAQNGADKNQALRALHRLCKHVHRQLSRGVSDDELGGVLTRLAGLSDIGNGRKMPLLSEAELSQLFALQHDDALKAQGALLSPKDVREGPLATFWHSLPPQYRRQCVRVTSTLLREQRDEVFSRYASAAVCVPLEVLLPAQPNLAEFWAKNPHTVSNELSAAAEIDGTGQSWAAAAAYYLEQVWPKLDLTARSSRLFHTVGLSKKLDVTDAPAFAAYKKALGVVWKDRALFGVGDLVGRSGAGVDWKLVFEAVGVDEKTGYAELNRALAGAAKSGELKKLIDHASESIISGKYYPLSHLVPSPEQLDVMPKWIDAVGLAALDSIAPAWKGGALSPGDDGALLLRAIPRYARPQELLKVYRREMSARFAARPPRSIKELAAQHRLVSGSWEGFRTYDFYLRDMKEPRRGRPPVYGEMSILLELIDRSGLENKSALIRELVSVEADQIFESFEKDRGMFPATSWVVPDDSAATLANLEILQRHGVAPKDSAELIAWYRERASYRREGEPWAEDSHALLSAHFDFVNLISTKVAPALERAGKKREIGALPQTPGASEAETRQTSRAAGGDGHTLREAIAFWTEVLFRSSVDLEEATVTRRALGSKRGDGLEDLRALLVEAAGRAELSVAETLELHKKLTIVAPTRALDQMLHDVFVRAVTTGSEQEAELAVDYVLKAADDGRLATRDVIAGVTRHLLEGELASIEGTQVRPRHLYRIIAAVTQLMGGASGPKDQVLEEIADRLRLDAKTCERFIEVAKSSNFRLLPSYIAQAVSLSSFLVTQLSRPDLEGVVDFVLGTKTRLPDGLTRTAAKHAALEATGQTLDAMIDQAAGAAKLVETTKAMAEGARTWLENRVHETSIEQRGVLVGLLLTLSGDKDAALEDILVRFGRFQPDSVALKHATCLLETLPREERGVALGLVLAHASERGGEMNLAAAAEVFRTVGLKLAQLVSVWKVFGEVSSSAEDAKDRAKGIARGPALRIIESELDSREQALIGEVGDQVAAASIKSCRKMIKNDGTPRAMMIRDPSADGQVEENLNMLNQYFERARGRNLVPNEMFFADILEDFSSMLFDEIDFRKEADKIRRASGLCEVINQELAPMLDGWSFVVPKVDEDFHVSPNVMVLEFAKGARVRALREDKDVPRELLEHVGRATLAFKLKLALDHGEVSPDPHTGNVWVDIENKQIYLLDWGQLMKLEKTGPFESDDRYVFVRFLAALKTREPARIVSASVAMLREQHLDDAARRRVTAAVQNAVKTSAGMGELLPEVVRALSEAGAPVRSAFTVGLLKQLMILEGENYVSREECLSLISEAAQSFVLNKKAPRFLLDQLRWS